MSRSLSRLICGAADVITVGQSPKRRVMTYARVIERLETAGAETVATAHGPMRILAARGPHLAAAALGFDEEEPETLGWIDGFRPGERLWDVGAAAGLFSMYAAMRGIEVTAFEPKATSFGVLVEHLALNGLGERVSPLCLAFSDRTGLTRLTLSAMAPGSGGNSVDGRPDQFGRSQSVFSQATLAYRMDDFRRAFGLAAPHHLKVDVDGAEGPILAGAPETLAEVRSVLVEVEGENDREAATRIDPFLLAAGLTEEEPFRGRGSGRNRLYRRA